MKKILVTGATGFVGRNLVRELVRRGAQVTCMVRKSSAPAGVHSLSGANVLVHDGTTQGAISLLQHCQPQLVFHLASMNLADHRPHDVQPLLESNILFGTQILEAMKVAGVRNIINTGTYWQHYDGEGYNPVCLYAACKQAFQDIARFYEEALDFRVITLTLFDTYGPDDPRSKLFGILQEAVRRGEEIELSPGEQLLDFVYIDDVVAAYLRAAELIDAQSTQRTFAVRTGTLTSIRQAVFLFEKVWRHQLRIKWGGRRYREREVMRPYSGEVLPGWAAITTLEAGLRRIRAAQEGHA
jgi:nucleoside-diphosphate-sugar epimerase